MNDAQVINNISALLSSKQNREYKYRRNFNRFVNNGRRTEDVNNPYGNPLAYFYVMTDDDTGIIPQLNVMRSAVETICSKMSQLKMMPFFNPVNGTWNTYKICRQAKMFFDEFLDDQEAYTKSVMALRYALAIEYGAIWIDDESLSIKLIRPWQYYEDAAEYQYGKITRSLLEFQYYPLIYLEDKIKGTTYEQMLGSQSHPQNCKYRIFFDLKGKMKYELIGTDIIKRTKIEYDINPVVTFYANEPLKGNYSVSLEDTVYTIQQKIDSIMQKISDAMEVSPFNVLVLPEEGKGGTNIKPSVMSTQAGIVVRYDPSLVSGASVVQIASPAPISPEYKNYIDWLEQKIYNLEGVSQLSAQSKKPTGLNSGVALQTLEDVESDRFQDLEERFKQFMMRITKNVIAIFPEKADVLPNKLGRAKIKWVDIKKEKESFSIQFGNASALSKDPSVKMGEIQQLIQMGIIPADMAPSLLDFPDLEKAFSISSASYDDCQKIIERAAEQGEYDFFDIINLQQLFSETTKTILRLDAVDENKKVLENLSGLLKKIAEKINEVQEANQQQQITNMAQQQAVSQAIQQQGQPQQVPQPAQQVPAPPQAVQQ